MPNDNPNNTPPADPNAGGSSWADQVPWGDISDTLTGLFDSLWGNDVPPNYGQPGQPADKTSQYMMYGLFALALIMVIFMLKK